ncbi:MAG: DUF3857 domain-containing protein [Pyrinomonadaceae bacterium]
MRYNKLLFLSTSLAFVLFLSGNLAANPAGDESAPAWLQQAARVAVPQYQKDVPAVVLHNEQTVNVNADGLMTITTFYAVRLLTRGGKNWADADALYLKSSSKVNSLRGWLFRANGTTKYYGKDTITDRISDPDDIYDEYRVKIIDASDDADLGMVFGYESVVEERPLFTQDRFAFQGRLPSLFSKYTLKLPAGWRAKGIAFNRPGLEPTVNGSSYPWELRDMDAIPPEPDSLSVSNLAPRLAVNYSAPNSNERVYDSWKDVSTWYTDLSAASLTLDDTVAGKARDLTVNAKTDLERIKAVAAFVQGIRYISLDIGIARGGGHRPRPANLVLARGFGDCKDKANLMRTMLKALKIESYLVLIYSGDPTYVRAEWASPGQFNHCIIAIKVGSDTNSPSVITNEKLGRLMIFDATDPYTQVGDLPDHEQGSFALVSAGQDGDLLKMPILPPDANKVEREAEVTLSETGAIDGKIYQKSFGQSASTERARMRNLTAAEYRIDIEKWLSNRVKGGSLTKALPTDLKDDSRFDLHLEFAAPMYAQIMQGRLMMFKPAMVGRLDTFSPVEGKRLTPILIEASSYSESIKIKLPVGFVIDEIPEADKIETAYGKYASKYEVSGGFLLFSRRLVLNRTVVPASGYEDVRNFFGVVRNAEQAPVVLVRK